MYLRQSVISSSIASAGYDVSLSKYKPAIHHHQSTRRKHNSRHILKHSTKYKKSQPVKLFSSKLKEIEKSRMSKRASEAKISRINASLQSATLKKPLKQTAHKRHSHDSHSSTRSHKKLYTNYSSSSIKKPKIMSHQYSTEFQDLKQLLKNSSMDKIYRSSTLKKQRKSEKKKQLSKSSSKKLISYHSATVKKYQERSNTKRKLKSKATASARKLPVNVARASTAKKHSINTHARTSSSRKSNTKDIKAIMNSNISSQSRTIATPNELQVKDLKVKSLLGEGAFSKVYLATFDVNRRVLKAVPAHLHNKNIAMKIIPRKKTKHMAKNLMWEKLILSQLNHPFIVNYYGSFVDAKRTCILLEFVIGGEILHYFETCRLGRFSAYAVKFYVAEITAALSYCHSKNYVYRDLKPENLLLDSTGHIKLIDFGFAKKLKEDQKTYTLCGSKEYVAPEVLIGNGHSFKVDCWSLGVLMYELAVGQLPFETQDCNPFEVLDVIRSTKIRFPTFIDNKLIDVILRLLQFSPHKRLNLYDLQSHIWFKDIDWKKCNHKQLKPPIMPKFSSQDDASNFANSKFADASRYHDSAYENLNMF